MDKHDKIPPGQQSKVHHQTWNAIEALDMQSYIKPSIVPFIDDCTKEKHAGYFIHLYIKLLMVWT